MKSDGDGLEEQRDLQGNLRTITLGPLTPSQLADLEIKGLWSDGGCLTVEDVLENARRAALLKQKIIAIIKKHGVEAEHIAPRLVAIKRLEEQLEEERSWVTALTEG